MWGAEGPPRSIPTPLRPRPAVAAPNCISTPLPLRPAGAAPSCNSAPLPLRPAAAPPRGAQLGPRPAATPPGCRCAQLRFRSAAAPRRCRRAPLRPRRPVVGAPAKVVLQDARADAGTKADGEATVASGRLRVSERSDAAPELARHRPGFWFGRPS